MSGESPGLPVEGAKLRNQLEVSGIFRLNREAVARDRHRNHCVIGKACLADKIESVQSENGSVALP